MRFDGMVSFRVGVNLRYPLRLACRLLDHDWQHVGSIHPLLGGNYNYCKRCGWGWRTQGLEHTPRFCRHRWEDDGGPSRSVEPGQPFETGIPFRQLQRCPRCRAHRCLDCATGQVVA